MKLIIHYEINGNEDAYIIAAESIEEVRAKNKIEMEKRGLTLDKNNCWSEVL